MKARRPATADLRYRVREARPATAGLRHGGSATRRRCFSLIEVLLAVFILSIGVISITALFPAGILQQRQSVDDITGPIVAQNALAILRTKLRPGDFGFDSGYTVDGDFRWSRPAFYMTQTVVNNFPVPPGTIDIFNDDHTQTNTEIPYVDPSVTPPHIVFVQSERYYPMRPINASVIRPPKPQYVWDCMFRRFQGKVMVAIFVYRTTVAGGGDVNYRVPQLPPPNDTVPPMPIWLDITSSELWADEGPWDADGDQFIRGTRAGEAYDTADQRQSWQEPGQWILDQNNNLHRVLSQNRASLDTTVEVEMVRPVPQMPQLWVYSFPGTVADLNSDGLWDKDVVSDIFYIPREVTLDGVPVRLTPVYVTVREL